MILKKHDQTENRKLKGWERERQAPDVCIFLLLKFISIQINMDFLYTSKFCFSSNACKRKTKTIELADVHMSGWKTNARQKKLDSYISSSKKESERQNKKLITTIKSNVTLILTSA